MINEKVKLRPFKNSDAEELSRLINNKKLWDNLRDYIPHPYTIDDAKEYINNCISSRFQTNFAIEYTGELVGSIGLVLQTDIYKKSAEIGYWLGEAYWGKGIATKAVRLIVDYGFNNLDIVRIFTGIFDFNKASQRVLEKNGFQKEAVFKKAIFKNGRILDEIRYAKLK